MKRLVFVASIVSIVVRVVAALVICPVRFGSIVVGVVIFRAGTLSAGDVRIAICHPKEFGGENTEMVKRSAQSRSAEGKGDAGHVRQSSP